MEIRIGIQNVARELVFETKESKEDVEAKVRAALSGETGVLELTDDKDRAVIVSAAGLAYAEIGDATPRPVGFVAG